MGHSVPRLYDGKRSRDLAVHRTRTTKPTLTRTTIEVEAALGGAAAVTLTQDDLLKMKADLMAISELNCATPLDVFDLVEDCTSAHETWNTLHQLFAGTDAAKYKKMMSAINAFSNFKALPSECL
ncbi:hypothetical protein LXL04_034401 [Taraxacum kok-saghyz]